MYNFGSQRAWAARVGDGSFTFAIRLTDDQLLVWSGDSQSQ